MPVLFLSVVNRRFWRSTKGKCPDLTGSVGGWLEAKPGVPPVKPHRSAVIQTQQTLRRAITAEEAPPAREAWLVRRRTTHMFRSTAAKTPGSTDKREAMAAALSVQHQLPQQI